ncbi:MAG: GNAT family N-acetyltransferase [Betaproteobacteria bacterium]
MDCRDITFGFAYRRDAETLAQMSRDLVEAGLGWSYQAHRVAELIADPETVTLVARDGSRPVGFGIMKYGDERAHLVLLAVSPTHQRRGIARRTIGWLLESAKVAGMSSVHVELRADNRPAYLLYRTLAFGETFRVNGYYRGQETAVKMVRVLRGPAIR